MAKTAIILILLATSAFAQTPRPLGTFTLGATTSSQCPTSPVSATCWNFTVTMPGAISSSGVLALEIPAGTVVATDLFFSIENGNAWWGGMPNPANTNTLNFFSDLLAANHRIILIKWTGSWYTQTPAQNLGPLAAACRPSTVIQWVKDNYPAAAFNVIGSSNGAAIVAYALADYGITGMTHAIVDSGPPQMAIKKACEPYVGYEYNTRDKGIIDAMYGYSSNGPCVLIDTSFEPQWDSNSVEANGTFCYPGVDVHVFTGTADNAFIQNRAADYRDLLSDRGQGVTFHSITGMGHGVMGNASALAALEAILIP